MGNSLLYVLVVLIWGSTWIAIKYQVGPVAPEYSVAYRFLLAAVIMFATSLALIGTLGAKEAAWTTCRR